MDFLVLCHLRWNFVFQRPQHLMTRCAKSNRVFFWEEPIFDTDTAFLDLRTVEPHLHVAVPHLPERLSAEEICTVQEWLLAKLTEENAIKDPVLWYYTPMACQFSRRQRALAVVYDCMDELSAFRGAPPGLQAAERELFSRADLVFTGGNSLYQSKKRQHPSIHCFPSSIDRDFFQAARHISTDVEEQAEIPHPRLGYCGVIDERMDVNLVDAIAEARPDWHIVMLGPVVKIDPADLPRRRNIHYLGAKEYRALPSYMAGWDVGLLPFALNESTRFISPTKTPEYLAAGLPVVSTPIADVVEPYGTKRLVEVAGSATDFLGAVERLIPLRNDQTRLRRTDQYLSRISWDLTWGRMSRLVDQVATPKRRTTMNQSTGLGTMAGAD